MPDDVKKDSSEPSVETLEKLFREAEDGATLAPDLAHANPGVARCGHFTNELVNSTHVIRKCISCGHPYCEDCESPLDPNSCKHCLPPDSSMFSEAPLVDDEGVTHAGRVITPSPELKLRLTTTAKAISDMDSAELEKFIQQYKTLVKQAELALDYRRVVLGGAELEKSQRAQAERRRLRAQKTPTVQRNVAAGPNTTPKRRKSDAPGGGLSPLQMLEAMRKLGDLAKAKAAQVQAQAPATPSSTEVKK